MVLRDCHHPPLLLPFPYTTAVARVLPCRSGLRLWVPSGDLKVQMLYELCHMCVLFTRQ